jgi:hypothetical protein
MQALTWLVLVTAASALTIGCGGKDTSDGSSSSGGATATGGADPGAGGTAGGTTGSGGAPGAGGAGDTNISIGEGCDPLEPCEGDIEGTWEYQGACADWEQLGVDPSQLEAMCPEATWESTGSVTGTVTFTDGTVTRDATVTSVTDITVPDSCIQSLGQGLLTCPTLGLAIAQYLPGAVCTADGTDCLCTAETTSADWGASTYTVSGSTLTLDDGRTFDFCTDGTTLRYQETGDSPEPGIYDLAK